ncbi:Fungal specific transcription factor [Penicillium frequentans]|uniref:Fungal specific transcription factor n=1 Tax=Penicillium frequentans TaxID=3151616 RepID=A0AAD6CTA2_9EURO|nr:Fungal specific transcription factor [Penicillium glabrum]
MPKASAMQEYIRTHSNDLRTGRKRNGHAYPPGDDLGIESSEKHVEPQDIESNFVKAIGLSSLIHPTHDRRQSDFLFMDKDISSTSLLNLASAQNLMADACDVFGLSLPGFEYMTELYFDTMNQFSLFHRPSFAKKVQAIKISSHRQALFAAMFSHSARFRSGDSLSHHNSDSMRFHNQALDLIYESLDEASDEQPSLCLLQAMVLVTFYELTKGVKGRAWRLLGSCVRVAYELHLHLIDYEALEENYKVGRDLSRWIEEEEGRRCWWAIWKMDVFASVIRRLPTAIDWNMIDTYLPASDEHWISNQYCRSCFLERDPVARPKALKDSGNENPDAWLIVITSIIRDAQVLHKGNLQGILMDMNAERCSDQILHYFRNSFSKRKRQEDSSRLQSLVHALQCTTAAMPQSLHHDKSLLDFEAHCSPVVYDAGAKQLQSAKYNIYLSLKHAQFMIYHHHAFDEIVDSTYHVREIYGVLEYTPSAARQPGYFGNTTQSI